MKSLMRSPFKLATHFRGTARVLALALAISLVFNLALVVAQMALARNFATPRIVVETSSGVVLPLAAAAFTWNPDVAQDFVKRFLPIVYTFSPAGTPGDAPWSPFIHPELLKTARDRFTRDRSRIQTEGLHQTLYVREVVFDPDLETAHVTAELRLLTSKGELTRTSLQLEVSLITTSDPLNPYGHAISEIH